VGALLTGLLAQFGLAASPRSLVVKLGMALFTLLALLATARRARRPGPEALGWRLIAAFLLIVFIIQVLRIPASFGHPIPLAAGEGSIALQVLGSCLQVAALLLWPLAPSTRFERIRHGLDGLLFALAVFFVLWGLVLGPAFLSDRIPMLDRFIWLATFLIYDLLLGLTVYLGLSEPSRFRGPLGWLAGAFMVASLFNFYLLMRTLAGGAIQPPPAGSTFAIPLAYLGAALSPRPVRSGGTAEAPSLHPHLLPYLPVLGATVLGIWLMISGTRTGSHLILIWLALALVLVVLVRQYLALRDYFTLSRHLETRVAERTAALEKAQALLMRTERMTTLATLGAGIAHDVNNLLVAIQGRVELVMMDLDEGKLPDRVEMTRVQEAAQNVASLSARLMTLGRREAGPACLLDLGDELRSIQPLLQVLLPKNQTLCLLELPGPMPFMGSRGVLEQVLVNLVSNARDAMATGGTITLRGRAPLPEDVGEGPLLEIEDTGCGIPEELRGQVFQPFFTTKASGMGTGLGLVSVKTLLENMGGSIGFVSQVGRGTVFQVRLPGPAART
jgi:signal transduction histidine kinase